MKEYFVFIFLLIGVSKDSIAQNSIDTSAIKKQLDFIYARDQITRTNDDSLSLVDKYDSLNLIEVEALIKKYGWPGKSFVGVKGNRAVFLVIQHSNITVQEKYLSVMIESVNKNESRTQDLALLQDRVLMREGKPQIYGSQVVRDSTGAWVLYKIEDEKNVNFRRAKAGLETLEEYARYFGIEYKQPVE